MELITGARKKVKPLKTTLTAAAPVNAAFVINPYLTRLKSTGSILRAINTAKIKDNPKAPREAAKLLFIKSGIFEKIIYTTLVGIVN
jgi:hypothetical protein